MQNIKELREDLSKNYEMMKAKQMDLALGKQLANTAGKMLTTIKIELEYAELNGEKKKIEFMEY